jgi:hypothetical protein
MDEGARRTLLPILVRELGLLGGPPGGDAMWRLLLLDGRQQPQRFAAHALLADQYRAPARYLIPDERDFFLMYLRSAYVRH